VTITGSMKLRRRSTLTDCCRGAATLTRDKDVAMVETMSSVAMREGNPRHALDLGSVAASV